MLSEPLNQILPPFLYIFIIFALWGKEDLELWRRWLGTISFCGMVIFSVAILGGETLFVALLMGSMTILGSLLGLLWRHVIMRIYHKFAHQIPSGDD